MLFKKLPTIVGVIIFFISNLVKNYAVSIGKPTLAIIDNFGIVRQSYYWAIKELGFEVSILSSDWKEFNNKVSSCNISPDICLINIDSTIYSDLLHNPVVRSYLKNAKIIGYTLSEDLPASRSEHVTVYLPFNIGLQSLKDIIYNTIQS